MLTNRKSRTVLLCSKGRKPLKQGIAHCQWYQYQILTKFNIMSPVEYLQNLMWPIFSDWQHCEGMIEWYIYWILEPAWICIIRHTALIRIIHTALIVINYWSLNSITVFSPWVCRICIRWVSSAFQTPTLNSCIRSTTNRVKKSNPSLTSPNHDENMFWKSWRVH